MSEKILPQDEKNYTAEEYLEMERTSATKNEYANGRFLAVAGSNRTHNLIASNFTISVGNRVHGQKTEVYVGNMRVQNSSNRFTYPDVIIVSGKPSFSDNQFDVLLNPTVVVEIFSKNTNTQDITEKLESYLAMESVREYLLIKEDEMRVEHYAKQSAKQWVYRIYNDREEVITLESISCKVSLTEIYSQINFETAGKKAGV
ncbi:MAG: Uma2 family endonuclease [Pyrinomonadaceae bacterium]